MIEGLAPGLRNRLEMKVDESKSACSLGSGTLPVLGTPAVAALMERTAEESVRPFLEEGQATVGTRLALNHTAATPLGGEVFCVSELTEIDRRRLVFRLTVCDAAGQIADAEHERFVVDAARFMEKADKRGGEAC